MWIPRPWWGTVAQHKKLRICEPSRCFIGIGPLCTVVFHVIFTWSKYQVIIEKLLGHQRGLDESKAYIRVLANSCSVALWTKLNVKIVDVPCCLARVGKVFPTNYAVPLYLMNIAKHIVYRPFLFYWLVRICILRFGLAFSEGKKE